VIFRGLCILTSWGWRCSSETYRRICKNCTIVYVVCNCSFKL